MIYYVTLTMLFLFSLMDLNSNKEYETAVFKKYTFFISCVILIIFAGLRFDTGWDYKGYHYYYDMMPSISNLSSNLDLFRGVYFEPGFKILMSLSKTLELDFYGFQFLVSLICICIIYSSIKEERSKLLFVFVYFSTCYLFLNMSVIRQGIAVALLFLSLTSLFSGRRKTAFLYILIGSLFHFSLVFFIPIIIIADTRRVSNKIFNAAMIIALIIYLLQIHWLKNTVNIFSPILSHDINFKITGYFESERFGKNREIGFGLIEKITTYLILIYIYRSESSRRNLILLRFFILYMVIYFAFYEATVLYDRLRLYFVAINVFVYVSIFEFFKGYNRLIAYAAIVIYSTFSFINVFRSDSNIMVFLPYHNVFESEKDIPFNQKGDLRIDHAIDMDR